MKGPHRHLPGRPPAKLLFQPSGKLGRGFVCKGHGCDLPRRGRACLDQAADAVHKRARLACAGSRDDCNLPPLRADRFPLPLIQPVMRGRICQNGRMFLRAQACGRLFRRAVCRRGRFFSGRFFAAPRKKAYLAGIGGDLTRVQKRGPPIFAVVSRLPGDLAGAQAAHALRHAGPRQPGKLLKGDLPQDRKLRAKLPEQLLVPGLHLLACGRRPDAGGDCLRQRNDTLKILRQLRPESLRAVGQLLHAVQHPHGDPPPADRADAARRGRLGRRQAHLAAAVPVHMIFALLGIKFKRPQKFVRFGMRQRVRNRREGKLRIEQIGLPRELRRGMRVRV